MVDPVLLKRKAQKLRKETGDERWKAPIEKQKKSISKTVGYALLRPFQLLVHEPMCLILDVYSAILLGILQAETWIVVHSADPSWTQAAADNFARIGISIGIVVFVLKLANEAWRQRDLIRWPDSRNAASA